MSSELFRVVAVQIQKVWLENVVGDRSVEEDHQWCVGIVEAFKNSNQLTVEVLPQIFAILGEGGSIITFQDYRTLM